MRLFIGIELDDRVRTAAAAAAARLRSRMEGADKGLSARWVPAENLHVTLWFIGDVADSRALEIDAALRTGFDASPFTMRVAGFGAFPTSGPLRVFWLGVRAGSENLSALYAQTAALLIPKGREEDHRAYSAHVTVARIKATSRGSGPALRRILLHESADCGECRVSAVTLFRSRISSRGATYDPLLRVPLQ
ncbi:MAG: RNA 2',3'-cyclic phosphodiesterase [Acidobacteria bacterium]|nr:RNA 2',3'-cyclic phosphodiesterase [Acidobacteriota bacterium]MCA1649477.1 RNA 2',3'-cyclic phosphodiesterase [Acidobacteriota bacterium]